MEQKHTPEPWRLGKFKRGADFEELPGKFDVCVDTDNGVYVLASTNTNFPEDAEANARRIVACVNACSGIATEQLERHYNAGGGIDSAMEESALREQIAVYKQRDQLRHRVERAERALQRVGWTYIEGADEWKPPVGPSASPLLERIDQLQAERDQLVERINKTLGEDVTYMNQRDQLLASLERIINACDECETDDDKSIVDLFTEEMEADARAAISSVKGGAPC